MNRKRSAITLTILGLAALLWGSVVLLFAATIGVNLVRAGLPSIASMPTSFFLIAPIWIGTPFVGFALSLFLLARHLWRGQFFRDRGVAIALLAIGLPWTALQWLGLGAG